MNSSRFTPRIILLLFLLLFTFSTAAYASEPLTLKSAEISVMPEYDTQPTEQLYIWVIQPLKATEMKLNPDYTTSGKDAEGFTYYEYSFTNPGIDSKHEIFVSYQKTDPNPSIQLNTGSVNSTAGNSDNSSANFSVSTFIIVFFLTVAALIPVVWLINDFIKKKKPSGKWKILKKNRTSKEQKLEELWNRYQTGAIDAITFFETKAALESEDEN